MRASLILSLAGTIIAFFGLSFTLPILAGLLLGEDIRNLLQMFGIPMVLCIGGGGFLYSYFHIEEDIRNRESFVLVSVVWMIMVLIGALPYMISEQMGLMSYEIGLAGALFESMSGLTTTGATMLEVSDEEAIVNSEQYGEGYFDAPKSLLLWRSQTQWLGGMGIIVLATIIFSRLFGGGIQVLQAEMPGTGISRLKPQMAQTARLLWTLYLVLTVAEIVLLRFLGDIPLYDAVCNSFSTISTGGFSPKIDSIGSYDSVAADSIVTFFMLISGVNFVLLYYASTTLFSSDNPIFLRIKKSLNIFRENDELKLYLFLVLTSFSLVFINLVLESKNNTNITSNFRYTAFQIASLLTGTGFTTTNYTDWPKMSVFVLLLAMFMGGCAGSTTGGIKMVRIMLLLKALRRELILVIHPRAIIKLRIGDKVLDEDLFRNVGVFFFIFIILFLIGSLVTLYLEPGLPLIDGISTSLSCIANIGPGIGVIGPTETYNDFGDPTLIFLSMLMMLGRLEIITVLLLFFPDTYRD
jgi:trk system potassium uptake protein TrkH